MQDVWASFFFLQWEEEQKCLYEHRTILSKTQDTFPAAGTYKTYCQCPDSVYVNIVSAIICSNLLEDKLLQYNTKHPPTTTFANNQAYLSQLT